MSLHVTARVASDNPDALIPLLRELTGHSRNEPGCLAYGWYRNGDSFTSIEHWSGPEAERAHNQTEFLHSILARIRPLLSAQPEVTRWAEI